MCTVYEKEFKYKGAEGTYRICGRSNGGSINMEFAYPGYRTVAKYGKAFLCPCCNWILGRDIVFTLIR